MKAVALLAVVAVLIAQAINPSPRQLLESPRTLTTGEIARVLMRSREVLIGKTFRLSSGRSGRVEVLMGPGGQPKTIRWTSTIEGGITGGVSMPGGSPKPIASQSFRDDIIYITEYTGRPARRCDGTIEQGEMVIEYQHHSTTQAWTVNARPLDARNVRMSAVAPALEMLRAAVATSVGERRQIGGRSARAIVVPWVRPAPGPDARTQPPILTGDPMPNMIGDPVPDETIQSLWIDTESLLPLRWDISKRGMRLDGFDFRYEPIDLRPPAGVEAPDCIR